MHSSVINIPPTINKCTIESQPMVQHIQMFSKSNKIFFSGKQLSQAHKTPKTSKSMKIIYQREHKFQISSRLGLMIQIFIFSLTCLPPNSNAMARIKIFNFLCHHLAKFIMRQRHRSN